MTVRTAPARPRDGGYTLTELLLAMGLFSMLGVGLVSLLSRASDFLTVGTSTTETLDSLQTFSEAFSEDVATLYTVPASESGRPDVRMYSDVVECRLGEEGEDFPDDRDKAEIQRLFFVRMIPNEGTAPLTRAAGMNVEAKGVLDQQNDSAESADAQLRATGGLMEVFWAAVPESMDDPAVMRLYRGYRSPIGGAESLLPTGYAGDAGTSKADRGARDRHEIEQVARPILSGVLHFGVQFWSRRTETWDERVTPPKGPLHTWDSTRGIMPRLQRGGGHDGFNLAQGAESLDDPTDDTFPRRIRVTLVVEEVAKKVNVGTLAEGVDKSAKYIRVEDARFIPAIDQKRRFVKIGAEWIEFSGVDSRDGTLQGCVRGARGTVARAHSAGAPVHHGRTVVREFRLATFRDTYADDLPAKVGR